MFMTVEGKGRPARRERRFAVELDAVLRGVAAEQPVRLLDLSRGGALVACARPPAADAAVTLVRGALTIDARVAWSRRDRFGLEFARPIRATELFVQLSLSRGSPA
jgi:PilZ domain-containing protein